MVVEVLAVQVRTETRETRATAGNNGSNGTQPGGGGGGAGGPAGGSGGSGALGKIEVNYLDAATHLVFDQQPTTTVVGAAISPSPTVRALDSGNNLNTDYVGTITVTISVGTNTGTATYVAVAGIATLSNVKPDTASGSATISVTANDGITGATSSAFAITGSASGSGSLLLLGVGN